jgi:hypothetical protein
LLRDTEDFYENKHVNLDLLDINFTQHSDEDIYQALCRVNVKLIDCYIENTKSTMRRNYKNLYIKRNASFGGFRHT